MNFCSIEDAWGDNKISNQFQKYKNNENKEKIENACADPIKVNCPIKVKENIEEFTSNKNINIQIMNCDNIFDHISKCRHCYNKLYYKFNVPQRNEFINNLHNIINNNKDTIVLILIGIFIIMFFKLVNNITIN